ncbi:MAG TPA: alpha/beta hydrolase [Ktedonobacterales bacterium]
MATDPTDARAAPPELLALERRLLESVGVTAEQGDLVTHGIRLHYLTCGQGEPLVLIHGRGDAGASFAPILSALATRRRVFTLDLPGWGLSEKPPFRGHTPQDALNIWVNAVDGLMEGLGIPGAAVLGHSLGGFVAIGLALAHPERVERLILEDPAGIGAHLSPWLVRLIFSAQPERLARLLGKRGWRLVADRDPKRAPSVPAFDFEYAVITQPGIIASGARAFAVTSDLRSWKLPMNDRLAELGMPSLLLWGERDITTRYANAGVSLPLLPDARLITFADTGHAPHEERPTEFARVLLDWLDGGTIPERVE